MGEPIVSPWGSASFKNYEGMFKKFGIKEIPKKIREEMNYFLFERNIVFGHREFDRVVERIKNKEPFINMTGIATSGKFHLGHKIIIDLFLFFKKLGARNYFGICDIDAYTSRPDSKIPSLKVAKEYGVENISHILALGVQKKDIYIQSRKEARYYEFAFELSKKITENTFRAIYGHLDLGKIAANLLQYADILHPQLPEYEGKMPSITVIAPEQDPHLRAVRDLTHKLNSMGYDLELPSSLYIKHLSGLQEGIKMSSSVEKSAIYLSDSPKKAAKKIWDAVDGGRKTAKEQKKLGGKPEICRVYELMKFLNPNSNEVKEMYENCISGKFLCGDCKHKCAEFITKFLENHHKKLEKTKEVAEQMMFGK